MNMSSKNLSSTLNLNCNLSYIVYKLRHNVVINYIHVAHKMDNLSVTLYIHGYVVAQPGEELCAPPPQYMNFFKRYTYIYTY